MRRIVLAVAAALMIAVFVTTGWPPVLPGTEGTIGAAKRHQAQQMTSQDVKLGDTATQEFLQSDVVARVLADRSARAALANPEVRKAFESAAVRQAFESAEVRKITLHKLALARAEALRPNGRLADAR